MVIDDGFDIAAPLDRVWEVLKDIPRVAKCIPHAQIINVVDPTTYRAAVAVKVGPVSVSYNATVKVAEIDDEAHCATMNINGDEMKGRGGVNAVLTARVEPRGPQTHVSLHADASISGIIATVGGRMIEGVAKKTIAAFAENLKAIL